MFRLVTPLLGLLLLSACGFEPVYAERSASASSNVIDTRTALQGIKVVVTPDNTRPAQILQAALEDALYPGDRRNLPVQYRLEATPVLREWPAVIQTNQFVARTNVRVIVSAKLRDITTNEVLWSGQAIRQSSFNVAQADFATYVAREDALKRGLMAAAENMAMQLQAKISTGLSNPEHMSNGIHTEKGMELLPDMRDQDGMQTMAPY